MDIIINNAEAFETIVNFLKKYFKNVEIVENEWSHLADRSQNYYKLIVFENRNVKYSIKWNYGYCTLFYGDFRENEKTSFKYTFTKIKLDFYYPVEIGNNYNVVFWSYEIIDPFDDMSGEISPLRLPIDVSF